MQTKSSVSARIYAVSLLTFAASTLPAGAHHAMGGATPSNSFEGFVSGLAHPVIGMDHLAILVAVGLLAAAVRPGMMFAASFVIATVAGAGIHLLGVNIPGSEMLIAASVLLFGILLGMKRSPASTFLLGVAGGVGILHGYAYGEAIFGAQPQPLIAYMLGFACVQMAIAAGVFRGAKEFLRKQPQEVSLRPAGLVLSGFGLALLSSQIISVILPA